MNATIDMPETVVVVGGTSEIARALLVELARRRLTHVLLAGRDLAGLGVVADDLGRLGVAEVETAVLDVADAGAHGPFVDMALRRLGAVDLVVVAAGALGSADPGSLDATQVMSSISTNFAGPAALVVELARVLKGQGYGRIVVLGSVAGVRVRAANLVYGAAKAGLDGFCLALDDSLRGSGVGVTIVRPGFVRTKMTVGRRVAPFAVGPRKVALDIVRGLERGDRVVWSPRKMRPIFAVLRVLPRSLWRRLPG